MAPRVPAGRERPGKNFEPRAGARPLDHLPNFLGLFAVTTARSLDPTAQPRIVEMVLRGPNGCEHDLVRHPPVIPLSQCRFHPDETRNDAESPRMNNVSGFEHVIIRHRPKV